MKEARVLVLTMTATDAKNGDNICVRVNYDRNDGFNDNDIVTRMHEKTTLWKWKAFL